MTELTSHSSSSFAASADKQPERGCNLSKNESVMSVARETGERRLSNNGRPSNKKRIIQLLNSLDEPITASDVSERLGLTTQQVQGLLRSLSSSTGPVSKRSPLVHLGERWPTLYWVARHDR
jgi:hypothetical protein